MGSGINGNLAPLYTLDALKSTASLMGSGINGNGNLFSYLNKMFVPLPLWEVELMET